MQLQSDNFIRYSLSLSNISCQSNEVNYHGPTVLHFIACCHEAYEKVSLDIKNENYTVSSICGYHMLVMNINQTVYKRRVQFVPVIRRRKNQRPL